MIPLISIDLMDFNWWISIGSRNFQECQWISIDSNFMDIFHGIQLISIDFHWFQGFPWIFHFFVYRFPYRIPYRIHRIIWARGLRSEVDFWQGLLTPPEASTAAASSDADAASARSWLETACPFSPELQNFTQGCTTILIILLFFIWKINNESVGNNWK